MEFKFSIREFVTTLESRAMCKVFESKRTEDRPRVPIVLTVLERRYQECPGGSQINYLCRYHTANGYTEHWFNEIELVAHPELQQ